MLSLQDIDEITKDQTFVGKVKAATWLEAIKIYQESDQTADHARRAEWAKSVFANPVAISQQMLIALIKDNRNLTTKDDLLTGVVTDTTIETKVGEKVADFLNGNA